MRVFVLVLMGLGTISLVGCAHHQNVRPNADGLHSVVLSVDQKDQGYREAFSEAKHFCKEDRQQTAVVVSEKTEYVGSMDERTYHGLKTASAVASGIGAGAWVFGRSDRARDVGGASAVTGGTVNAALGAGYRYTLMFRCR